MDKFLGDDNKCVELLQVYNQLQDEESKEIYKARSFYSLTDNKECMKEIVSNSVLSKYLRNNIKQQDKKIVLFGAGTWGKAIVEFLDDIHWDYIIDNKKAGCQIGGYTINSLDYLKDYNSCYFVIALLFKYNEVMQQLLNYGVNRSNILVLGEIAEQKQYFDLPYLKLSDNEVFLDIGGFSGETSEQFIKETKGKYKRIYVFEPNKELAEKCRNRLSKYDNCEVIEKGCWSETTELGFNCAGEGSSIADGDNIEFIIETTSIDEVIAGNEVTYIKMDIEGAEYEALLGAEKTIKKYSPKLAISIYHKRLDIWRIPLLLLSYNPNYRFYLRTYSFSGNDTVLYAI